MSRTRNRTLTTVTRPLSAPPETVFPLLCPQREYEWIDTWACEIIYTESGFAEENCIFRTGPTPQAHIGRETWVCTVYEPPSRIAFVRTSDHHVARLDISLAPADGGRTIATMRILATGLDDAGDDLVSHLTPSFDPIYRKLLAKLDHFLVTGEMLPDDKAAA